MPQEIMALLLIVGCQYFDPFRNFDFPYRPNTLCFQPFTILRKLYEKFVVNFEKALFFHFTWFGINEMLIFFRTVTHSEAGLFGKNLWYLRTFVLIKMSKTF